MNRDREVALIRACLDLVEAGQPPATEEETLIPVSEYVDAERFAAERRMLFDEQLVVVGHACEIAAAGDFVTRDVLGRPVLMVRGDDGAARAFLNVCRHRGATLELRERGRCRRFVCPYHAWSYSREGALASVRHQSGFPRLDPAESGLVELACHERAGLLWVCPDPGASDLELRPDDLRLVEELEGLLGGLATADGATVASTTTKTYRANFKIIVDGGLESYHFRVAHRDTVASFFADNLHHYELLGRHTRTILPRVGFEQLANRPEDEWRLREQANLVYSVAPNASILVQAGHFDLILNTPLSIDETRVAILTVVPAPGPEGMSTKAGAFWAANHDLTVRTLDEDFVLAEQIQRGIATGANTHFRFATFEGALTAWHRQLNERLGARRPEPRRR